MASAHRKKSRRTNIWIMFLALCLIELMAYTWVRVQHVRTGYEIGRLTTENRELKERQTLLRGELARLRATSRLARIAVEMGLKRPEPGQIQSLP